MATSDLPRPSNVPSSSAPLPRINLFTMFRLGLFQMGLGLLSLLTLGILNQVLISELQIPAILAGGSIAMYQFVSPARVWMGHISDSKPIRGYHRTGYVWLGMGLQAICLFLAIQVVWQLGASAAAGWTVVTTGWLALLAGMFALYGLCIATSSTPFAALLVDVSDEDNRSQLVGIVWAMLMVGIVAGAIVGEVLLDNIAPEALQAAITRLFILFPLTVVGLGIVATVGIEKKILALCQSVFIRGTRRSNHAPPGDRGAHRVETNGLLLPVFVGDDHQPVSPTAGAGTLCP